MVYPGFIAGPEVHPLAGVDDGTGGVAKLC